MSIKPLDSSSLKLVEYAENKLSPTLTERLDAISKSLAPVALVGCCSALLASKLSIIPPLLYQASSIAFFSNPIAIVAAVVFLAILTTTLALVVLNKKQKIKELPSFSKELNAYTINFKQLNQDTRYAHYVTFNEKSLKNAPEGWVKYLKNSLEEERFSEERIKNILKSIEIQIFIPFFKEIESSLSALLIDGSNEPMQTTVTTTDDSCWIEHKKTIHLYRDNNGVIDTEKALGKVFIGIAMHIPKNPLEKEQAFYTYRTQTR